MIHLLVLNNHPCFGQKAPVTDNTNWVQINEFDRILRENQLDGSILIYDLNRDIFYSNDFEWASIRRLPASTFKVPHSIIALATGVMLNEESIIKWDGEPKFLKSWEQDLSLKDALQLSCVPCYQYIASKIGVQSMQYYLEQLEFGQMEVNDQNLTVFWLEGNSGISQFEQVDFYRRLIGCQLIIPKDIQQKVKEMMILHDENEYRLYGKTGWAIRNGHNNGWFVGWLQTGSNNFIFASNVDPAKDFDMSLFPVIRKEVTQMALDHLISLIQNE
jgi:beta-lactamase class D